jgi:hypothetical protein
MSSGPHKEGTNGMKRIIPIKDKTMLASWGSAFVAFVDVQVLCYSPCLSNAFDTSIEVILTGCIGGFSCNHVAPNSPQ